MKIRAFATLAFLLAAGACAPAPPLPVTLERPAGTPRILLMPPDIEVVMVTSMGLRIPVARWTRDAASHVRRSLLTTLSARGLRVREFIPAAGAEAAYALARVQALHHAAARSLQRHRTGSRKLPARKEGTRWTLGKGVAPLSAKGGADYALFLFLRDGYTSAGRAMQIALFALRTGFVISGGELNGYASLVHLKSGDIVWLRRLRRASGDLRTPGSASQVVAALLEDFPR